MSAVETAPRSAGKPPLAVDLDGTLIRGDLFIESMLKLAFAKPWRVFTLLAWLLRGRAYAKARLAEAYPVDAAILPYDDRVIAWLQDEARDGRTLALATASDARAAQAVADHLGLFDLVIASDGVSNAKAARKAERLADAFPQGFVYAGNERADIKVWRAAQAAVVVNASPGLAAHARREFTIERTFPPTTNTLKAFVKAIRPQQWSKNVLVFLPMLVGQAWLEPRAWLMAFLAFWALSFTASAVYLVNDAADIDADRRHPRKRRRPFASGALSPAIGLPAAAALLGLGLSLSAFANVLPLALTYLLATTLYTFWLKRVVLVDVFVLAGLYTIRILLGGAATAHFASDWLLAFSCFFFLSLALVKRVAETRDLGLRGGGSVSARGYTSDDTNVLTVMGVGAGFIAALVLALYLQDDQAAAQYREPLLLWGLPATALLWICRLWLKTHRGEMHDDPIVFAARDRASWALALIAGLCFIGAVSTPMALLPIGR